MASSTAFPPPHSCDFCRKLVLYKRDYEWWYKALEASPDVEAHIEGFLSTRVRTWLLEELGSRRSRTMCLKTLQHCAIFDCTLGEARLAANAGCNFCLDITHNTSTVNQSYNDNYFPAAHLDGSCFQILLLTLYEELVEFMPPTGEVFEILALPGKLSDSPRPRDSYI